MTRFVNNFPSVVHSSSATGWLTSVLQLGGILGSLSAGILGEIFSRKYTMFMACCWVILGSYLYVGAHAGMPSLLYAGRFFTGLGVGLFSGVGPLYNAELSAPEMRGFLVSFYQFATILGIMLSFWVGYGSNYIGGTGETQSNLAWRLPSIIQGIPAVVLAFGIWLMPFSPRWLVKVGRDDEARKTLAWLRKLPIEHEMVEVEYLEIKAEAAFEQRAFAQSFPKLAESEKKNVFMEQIAQYANCFRTVDNLKRICTAWLVMFFQQWSGIDASRYFVISSQLSSLIDHPVIYYASNVFISLGLTSGTIALLATGVTGVVFLVSTVPAMVSDRNGLNFQLSLTLAAYYRQSWSKAHAHHWLCSHVRQYGHRGDYCRPISPRLASPYRCWMDCRRYASKPYLLPWNLSNVYHSSYLDLHCWVWSNMGTCLMDPSV